MAAEVFNDDHVGPEVMPDMEPSYDIHCIETKEDLEYDDLCTLECFISYFDVDDKVISEIHQLKEDRLLDEIINLEEVIAKLKGYESRWDAIDKGGHEVFKGADA